MTVLGVDDFKSKLKGGGARPNLFKAIINFPPAVQAQGDPELTSFLCEAAQLPGSTIGLIEVPFRGRRLKIAGDRTFDSWTITIINDTDFKIRNSMERWLNAMNNHNLNTGLVDPTSYQADLNIVQLDKDGRTLKSYTFTGAFPTILSPIDLSYASENEIERFTVEFQYQYWTSNTTVKPDTSAV